MEWQAFYQQLSWSGDDMNIINVGRPAVSRYHSTRRLYMAGEGVNYDVHDFPTAELGLKLGGFMLLHGAGEHAMENQEDPASDCVASESDHEESEFAGYHEDEAHASDLVPGCDA
jgi:hypothetical protein